MSNRIFHKWFVGFYQYLPDIMFHLVLKFFQKMSYQLIFFLVAILVEKQYVLEESLQ